MLKAPLQIENLLAIATPLVPLKQCLLKIYTKAVQERLGHEDIRTTLQTYVHNTEDMEQSAVDIFENAVSNDK